MGEKTEAERAVGQSDDLRKEMAADFRNQIELMRDDHRLQVKLLTESGERRVAEIRDLFEERRRELAAQNDGMLGAVGRIHGEYESLKRRVGQLELELEASRRDQERTRAEAMAACERVHVECQEKLARSKKEAEGEIQRLRKALQLAKAGKKTD